MEHNKKCQNDKSIYWSSLRHLKKENLIGFQR